MTFCCFFVCLFSSVNAKAETVDYVELLKLDMDSETVKQEVTVRNFVDGDTVHFNVPQSVMPSGVMKSRFLALNTPESTGKIEEYGKSAARFTREKLADAVSIIVESDTDSWNVDSTGSRYLVWVWYQPAASEDYRNLNLEILQNGLAIANSTANNRYGAICMDALSQAKSERLNVHSGEKDPEFYYGDAVELTLRELRLNPEAYNGVKVAFSGVITINSNNSVFIEDYDEETGLYYGISVYYGYGLSGAGLDILQVGNESRIVGTLQYYEAGGVYQVSGLTYRMMKPDDPDNIQKISDGHFPAYVSTDANLFANGAMEIESGGRTYSCPYAELSMATSIEMRGLTVRKVHTTTNEDSASNGAMTMTCEADGVQITVRTVPLFDEYHNLITEEAYLGKIIDVRGIVDCYDGEYQIKVFTPDSITFTSED